MHHFIIFDELEVRDFYFIFFKEGITSRNLMYI